MLLLDVAMPDGDGFSFIEELKAERASSHLSVIFISARSDTASKIRALKLGGDDYLTKPFDAMELGARIESVLRRKEHELGASPTTQLPGSSAIEREVIQRLSKKRDFAFCYLDLDNLKAFNDYYGFAKADGVIRQTVTYCERWSPSRVRQGTFWVMWRETISYWWWTRPTSTGFVNRRSRHSTELFPCTTTGSIASEDSSKPKIDSANAAASRL